ncbi:MAG TPA: tetratricopeptide repeat protein, partial [Thermoanaerobaculia bacterium]
MKTAAALIALCLTCVAHAQTRIASAIEIRQMEQAAREGGDSGTRIAAYINLGDLRIGLNELAAAERDFKLALEIADQQRIDAWRLRDMGQYSLACSWMGVALGRLNRGPEAFAILEEAVRYAGNARGIWNPYSVAMYRLDRQEKGIGTGRIAVAISERNAATGRVSEHVLLELNIDRFALAQALLLTEEEDAENEAEQILLRISESLESDKFASLRKNLAKKEAFEIFTAPTTDAGIFLSLFNRVHMRLAWLYEKRKLPEKAAAEFKAVLSRRSDEPIALSGLARVAATAEERDRYLILSLDANPFAEDVVNDYVKHVASGKASPAVRTGSVGSLVRLAIQQIHANDLRRAQATLKELLAAHPNNDVLWALLTR